MNCPFPEDPRPTGAVHGLYHMTSYMTCPRKREAGSSFVDVAARAAILGSAATMPRKRAIVKRRPVRGNSAMRDGRDTGIDAYTLLVVALALFAAVLSTGPFLEYPGTDGERAVFLDPHP